MNKETESQEQYLFNQLNFEERKSIIELMKYIINLQQENHQLKDRVEKALEYINKHEKDGTLWLVKSTDELKEILKGEE